MEKSSSNSDWVKREGCLPPLAEGLRWFFAGRELMWGRHAEERSKIIPTRQNPVHDEHSSRKIERVREKLENKICQKNGIDL